MGNPIPNSKHKTIVSMINIATLSLATDSITIIKLVLNPVEPTAPTITLSDPPAAGVGTFVRSETITGSTSGVTGIVKTWNTITNVLTYSNTTGDFLPGETIVGSESSASYVISVYEDDNTVNNYPDNDTFETFANDGILDFSESNPFGNP